MGPKSSSSGGVTRGLLVVKRQRSPSRMRRELALLFIVTLGALLTAPFEKQMITADKQESSSPAPSPGSGGVLSPVPASKPPSLQPPLQPPQNGTGPSPQLGFPPSQNGRGPSLSPQLGFSPSQNGRAPSPSLQLGFQPSQNGRGPSPSPQVGFQPSQNGRGPSLSPQLGFSPSQNGRAPSPSLQLGFQPSQNGRGPSPSPQVGFQPSQNGRGPSLSPQLGFSPSQNGRAPSPSLQLGFQPSQNGRGPSPLPQRAFSPSQNGRAPSPSPELELQPSQNDRAQLPSPLQPSPLAAAPFRAFPQAPAGIEDAQIQKVIFLLRQRNYFTVAEFAGLYLPLVPPFSTLFVPPDEAFGLISPPFMLTQISLDSILSYHTVPQQFDFPELLTLPVDTPLPTLDEDNTILVTSVLDNDFRVDNTQIIDQDMCLSPDDILEISCHGIANIMNVTVWGSLRSSSFIPGTVQSRPMKNNSPVGRPVFMMMLTMGCAAALVV